MQTASLRTAFSIVEAILGLALMGLGSFSLLSNLDCHPDAHDCIGWGLLGAALFLPPGILVVVAACVSYYRRGWPLAAIQALLLLVLFVYFVLGFAQP